MTAQHILALLLSTCFVGCSSFRSSPVSPANVQVGSSSNPPIKLKSFSVGDNFTFEVRDAFNGGLERQYKKTVTAMTPEVIEFNHGNSWVNVFGNETDENGNSSGFFEKLPTQYEVGELWEVSYANRNGKEGVATLYISGRKPFNTSLGIFNVFVIEGTSQFYALPVKGTYEVLIDPERCSMPLSSKTFLRNGKNDFPHAEVHVLVECNQKR